MSTPDYMLLVNVRSNTCAGVSTSDSRSVTGYGIAGSANQLWTFEDAPDGTSYIKSVKYDTFLSVDGPPASDQRIIVSPTPFSWTVKQVSGPDGGIILVVPGTSWVVDLAGGNSEWGTPIILYRESGAKNQIWKEWIVDLDEGEVMWGP